MTKYKLHWIETIKAAVLVWRLPKHILEKKQTYIMCSENKVFGQYGALDLEQIESDLRDVNGVAIKQSFLGRILNYGTITITTPSTTHTITNIAQPKELKAEVMSKKATLIRNLA